ncbi:MAG: hypothetical protein V3V28_14115 [Polaribacter sp.]|uniref:hypothetical protein n=1 Tax=Polaribacter sp. TaxID=1920175 RepID=UPI002F35E116
MKTISTSNIKENTLKLNELALKSTEKVALKTINTVGNFQSYTSKTIKNSLNFTAKQQDNFFNNIENAKEIIWKNLNKGLDFFSKN